MVLVGAFVWWEQHTSSPMLNLGLFSDRRFTGANAVSFCMYAGVFGPLFFMAQFLQTAQGHSPLQTGVRLLPWTAAAMVASPIAGKLAERYGNRPFMAGGLFLQTVGMAWIALVATWHLGYAELGAALTLAGVGIGLVVPTVAGEVMGSVPPSEIGVASGTNSALRELGGVFGVAVLAAVFARHGTYASPAHFVDGFKAALWVGAGLSAAGTLAAFSAGAQTKPILDEALHQAPDDARPVQALTSKTP